ncbi:hypothetical protein AMATHDRAFT_2566 [Amanita thiersii Skay4041]|uniref:Transmembrane protein n=1 Tax=Amanita thiersii Skay4041 TaxID=703135 RepID=A0A2A9NUY0_9AGAR|nr:hypothetical protein AMATHDRAFT_2566 [Amanita thiersii Skay4041]
MSLTILRTIPVLFLALTTLTSCAVPGLPKLRRQGHGGSDSDSDSDSDSESESCNGNICSTSRSHTPTSVANIPASTTRTATGTNTSHFSQHTNGSATISATNGNPTKAGQHGADDSGSHKISSGAIAGIVIGIGMNSSLNRLSSSELASIVVGLALLFMLLSRYRNRLRRLRQRPKGFIASDTPVSPDMAQSPFSTPVSTGAFPAAVASLRSTSDPVTDGRGHQYNQHDRESATHTGTPLSSLLLGTAETDALLARNASTIHSNGIGHLPSPYEQQGSGWLAELPSIPTASQSQISSSLTRGSSTLHGEMVAYQKSLRVDGAKGPPTNDAIPTDPPPSYPG